MREISVEEVFDAVLKQLGLKQIQTEIKVKE
jgi:hypothetical protein